MQHVEATNATQQDLQAGSVEKIRDMISDIKVAMLTTTDADGHLHS